MHDQIYEAFGFLGLNSYFGILDQSFTRVQSGTTGERFPSPAQTAHLPVETGHQAQSRLASPSGGGLSSAGDWGPGYHDSWSNPDTQTRHTSKSS